MEANGPEMRESNGARQVSVNAFREPHWQCHVRATVDHTRSTLSGGAKMSLCNRHECSGCARLEDGAPFTRDKSVADGDVFELFGSFDLDLCKCDRQTLVMSREQYVPLRVLPFYSLYPSSYWLSLESNRRSTGVSLAIRPIRVSREFLTLISSTFAVTSLTIESLARSTSRILSSAHVVP